MVIWKVQPQGWYHKLSFQLAVEGMALTQSGLPLSNCGGRRRDISRVTRTLTKVRPVARVLERGLHFAGGLGDLPQKNFKFKVANTPKFNDFLQLPKKFWMSKYLLLTTLLDSHFLLIVSPLVLVGLI